jgi:hypothetical protein
LLFEDAIYLFDMELAVAAVKDESEDKPPDL